MWLAESIVVLIEYLSTIASQLAVYTKYNIVWHTWSTYKINGEYADYFCTS